MNTMKVESMTGDIDVDRVASLAESMALSGDGRSNILEVPLGVSEECLSASEIVQLLEDGTIQGEIEHLIHCNICMKNISAVSEVPTLPESKWRELWQNLFGRKSEFLRPILMLEEREIPVSASRFKDLSFNCSIVPMSDRDAFVQIAPSSLTLRGAITATAGKLGDSYDVTDDDRPDIFPLHFERGHLSRRVQHLLRRYRKVMDIIQVDGKLESSNRPFVSQAHVEIVSEGD